MALKKQEFTDDEIPIFEDALVYKRGDYWQMRMWLAKEHKYARFSLKTRNKSTAIDKAKLHYHELMAGQLAGKNYFSITTRMGVEKYLEQRQKDVDAGLIVSGTRVIGVPLSLLMLGTIAVSPIRQDYLETVISWISNGEIEAYMAKQQHKPNANELWLYYQSVINWVKTTFVKYRKQMKGIDWGTLYAEFKDKEFDSAKLELEIAKLMEDEDVSNKKGIYAYVLTRKEKHLNIRAFSDNQKREAYERQKGICTVCKEHFELEGMEADHITPWHVGGKTNADNCQMLCKEDNRRKSGV